MPQRDQHLQLGCGQRRAVEERFERADHWARIVVGPGSTVIGVLIAARFLRGIAASAGMVLAAIGVLLLTGVPGSLPPERPHTGGIGETFRAMEKLARTAPFLGFSLVLGLASARCSPTSANPASSSKACTGFRRAPTR
jgi:hypothetical protein